jgi:hypothetical protein
MEHWQWQWRRNRRSSGPNACSTASLDSATTACWEGEQRTLLAIWLMISPAVSQTLSHSKKGRDQVDRRAARLAAAVPAGRSKIGALLLSSSLCLGGNGQQQQHHHHGDIIVAVAACGQPTCMRA